MSSASRVSDWFEDRAAVRTLSRQFLYESIPGGARWRYAWGTTLAFGFLVQLITGVALALAYSPSGQTAWESVYFIEHGMLGGWLLRGLHHYMAHAMIILLAVHFLQVIIDGAYRAPRELNFIIGLLLMMIVLVLGQTGYLLPWDQRGYRASGVATELIGQAPIVGAALRKIALGGEAFGHHTLTRFYTLHAGVLPGVMLGLVVVHFLLHRRHGYHGSGESPAADDSAQAYWPDQALRDMVACLGVMAVVLGLAIWMRPTLGPPADPSSEFAAARPEWYFLSVFQLLKQVPGESEVMVAFYLPALLFLLLILMPWIGRWRLGHRFNLAFTFAMLLGIGILTFQSLQEDYYSKLYAMDPQLAVDDEAYRGAFERSDDYMAAVAQAERDANRVIELAQSPTKIPSEGALALLQTDSKTQGPKLFAQHCSSCHNYAPQDGSEAEMMIVAEEASAPNLFGLGTRKWIEGWLDPHRITSEHYFGYTLPDGEPSPFAEGDMVAFVESMFSDIAEDPEIADQITKVAAALAAEAGLNDRAKRSASGAAATAAVDAGAPDAADAESDAASPETAVSPETSTPADISEEELAAEGVLLITEELGCIDCHHYEAGGFKQIADDDYDMVAPDLSGYMSKEWLRALISNPAAVQFYGERNDRMPAFAAHDNADLNQLDPKTLGMIVDWLRHEWYEPETDAAAAETNTSTEAPETPLDDQAGTAPAE